MEIVCISLSGNIIAGDSGIKVPFVKKLEKIAEIFWKTKGVETKRVKSFYPTEREFVYPRV